MRGKKPINNHPKLKEFREHLMAIGYTKDVAYYYSRGVGRYIEEGNALTKEAVKNYFAAKKAAGLPISHTQRTGLNRFVDFINGVPFARKREKGMTKKDACDDDCFNCKYGDCIKPDYLCTSIPYEQ